MREPLGDCHIPLEWAAEALAGGGLATEGGLAPAAMATAPALPAPAAVAVGRLPEDRTPPTAATPPVCLSAVLLLPMQLLLPVQKLAAGGAGDKLAEPVLYMSGAEPGRCNRAKKTNAVSGSRALRGP